MQLLYLSTFFKVSCSYFGQNVFAEWILSIKVNFYSIIWWTLDTITSVSKQMYDWQKAHLMFEFLRLIKRGWPCPPKYSTIRKYIKFVIIYCDMMHWTGDGINKHSIGCPDHIWRMFCPDNNCQSVVQTVS